MEQTKQIEIDYTKSYYLVEILEEVMESGIFQKWLVGKLKWWTRLSKTGFNCKML
jgi:hypothetical protein